MTPETIEQAIPILKRLRTAQRLLRKVERDQGSVWFTDGDPDNRLVLSEDNAKAALERQIKIMAGVLSGMGIEI